MDIPRSIKEYVSEGFKFAGRYPLLKLSYALSKPILIKPKTVNIGVTDRCNYRCLMCWAAAGNLAPRDELVFEDFKKIIGEMKQLGIPFLGLSGGEPLLKYELMLKVIKYASQKGIKTTMSSNGFLLDEKKLLALSKAGLRRLSLSLDSTEEKEHDLIRGVKVFTKTISLLEKIKKLKDQGKINFAVHLNAMVLKQNYENLPKLADLAQKLEMSLVVQPVNIPALFSEQKPRENKKILQSLDKIMIKGQEIKKLEKICESLTKFKEEKGVLLNLTWQIKNIPDYYRSLQQGKNLIKFPCLAGFEVLDIAPDGEVRTCFYYPGLGNIKEKGLLEIIKSKQADLQRKAIKKCDQPCMLNCYLPMSLNVLINDVVFLPAKRFFRKIKIK